MKRTRSLMTRMVVVKQTIALFLFLSFFCVFVRSQELCSTSACGNNEPAIRFPFRIQHRQPKPCGYPGFDLSCQGANLTILTLPYSGKFTVQGIDYGNQEVWINDPDNCLPQRLFKFNLSASPFAAITYQSFTFFNCSTFDYTAYRLNPIACLSGSSFSMFATSSNRTITVLSKIQTCSLVDIVDVPVQRPFVEQLPSSDLSDDLRLAWASPGCRRCESRGGRCGFKSSDSQEIECKDVPRRELPLAARYAIIAGAGLPAFLCAIGLFCFVCRKLKSCRRRGRRNDVMYPYTGTAVVPQPTDTRNVGLDEPTIKSYPKTTLGESRRLPKPEDNVCSICLSEYQPKETLRSIPECLHCFHADCIDEWLRLNASCPVCRNSPQQKSPPDDEDQQAS